MRRDSVAGSRTAVPGRERERPVFIRVPSRFHKLPDAGAGPPAHHSRPNAVYGASIGHFPPGRGCYTPQNNNVTWGGDDGRSDDHFGQARGGECRASGAGGPCRKRLQEPRHRPGRRHRGLSPQRFSLHGGLRRGRPRRRLFNARQLAQLAGRGALHLREFGREGHRHPRRPPARHREGNACGRAGLRGRDTARDRLGLWIVGGGLEAPGGRAKLGRMARAIPAH